MKLEEMSYDDLRALKREKTQVYNDGASGFRAEMLAIQDVIDVRARERRVAMYAAAIGPEAVAALVEAATAEADAVTHPPNAGG